MGGGPAFGWRAAAWVDADCACGGAFITAAALGDGAEDLVVAGFDDWSWGELVAQPLADVAAEVGIVRRARGEVNELGFGADGVDVLAPGIVWVGDKGEDGVGIFEEFAGRFGEGGGVAKEVMPAGFDIGAVGSKGFLGELPFFAVGDVDDAGLGVETRESEGEGPGDYEISEGA